METAPPSRNLPGSSLRPATEEDLNAIVAVERAVHSAPWAKAAFQSELEKPYSRVWVMTDDDTDSEVLGYVVFWSLDQAVEVLNLAVALPYRGLGFAKQIMQQVIREALRDKALRLILDVRKSNLPAVSLYQKIGFSIIQVRKGFYSNGEDGFHMELPLEGLKDDFSREEEG